MYLNSVETETDNFRSDLIRYLCYRFNEDSEGKVGIKWHSDHFPFKTIRQAIKDNRWKYYHFWYSNSILKISLLSNEYGYLNFDYTTAFVS
jgi:hypothetical protein